MACYSRIITLACSCLFCLCLKDEERLTPGACRASLMKPFLLLMKTCSKSGRIKKISAMPPEVLWKGAGFLTWKALPSVDITITVMGKPHSNSAWEFPWENTNLEKDVMQMWMCILASWAIKCCCADMINNDNDNYMTIMPRQVPEQWSWNNERDIVRESPCQCPFDGPVASVGGLGHDLPLENECCKVTPALLGQGPQICKVAAAASG